MTDEQAAARSAEVEPFRRDVYERLVPEAQARFTVEELQTIHNTVMPTLRPVEFRMVLAMAARYDLDPMAREIWGERDNNGRTLILVGRDGLLKVARQDPSFEGFDADVVRENDSFRVRYTRDGPEVEHEYDGDAFKRGAIKGAWAIVYATGKRPTYFFAPWDEYAPDADWLRSHKKSSWYTNPSVMMQKCPLSLCLRLAFNLSGILAVEEAAKIRADDGTRGGLGELTNGHGDGSPADVELPEAVTEVLERAERLGRPLDRGTVVLEVGGQPEERVAVWVAERARELDVVEGIADAEVVPEESKPAAPRQRRARA